MSPDDQGSQVLVGEAIARQRIHELERVLAVSERCLISLTGALRKQGFLQSAASANALIGLLHSILHDKPRGRLH